jgi:hypothetical protein
MPSDPGELAQRVKIVEERVVALQLKKAELFSLIMTPPRPVEVTALPQPGPSNRPGKQRSAAARRLGAAAARMLPAGDRARYGEEFRSELAEIALAGGGRWVQLAYAARQLRSAPRLRADLRTPRRRGAAP